MEPVSPVLLNNECNLAEVIFAKDQPQYRPLPAIVTSDGYVTTRWKFTFRERLRILFGGSLYLQQLTFNDPLQPQLPSTKEPKFQLV
jgi:hypothetical protein